MIEDAEFDVPSIKKPGPDNRSGGVGLQQIAAE